MGSEMCIRDRFKWGAAARKIVGCVLLPSWVNSVSSTGLLRQYCNVYSLRLVPRKGSFGKMLLLGFSSDRHETWNKAKFGPLALLHFKNHANRSTNPGGASSRSQTHSYNPNIPVCMLALRDDDRAARAARRRPRRCRRDLTAACRLSPPDRQQHQVLPVRMRRHMRGIPDNFSLRSTNARVQAEPWDGGQWPA